LFTPNLIRFWNAEFLSVNRMLLISLSMFQVQLGFADIPESIPK